MFSLVVGICFAVAVVNAGFHNKLHHHHHHFTYDMNGFKGHHKDFSATFGPHPPSPVYGPPPNVYGPPPPNVYGPPPPKVYAPAPPPFNPHQHPQQNGYFPNGFPDHGTGCPSNFGANFGFPNMMPFNPFQQSNFPFNPMNSMDSMNMFGTQDMDHLNHQFTSVNVPIHILPPHSNGQDISNVGSNIPSANLPANPLPNSPSTFDVNTPIPLDANTVFANSNNVQSTTAANIIVPFNVDDHPQSGLPVNSPNTFEGSTEATNQFTANPKTDQNNGNNYNGDGAIAPNNNNNNNNNYNVNIHNQATVPNVSEPEATTAKSTQGDNDLMYDIDIRFSDTDNRTHQQQLDTIK